MKFALGKLEADNNALKKF